MDGLLTIAVCAHYARCHASVGDVIVAFEGKGVHGVHGYLRYIAIVTSVIPLCVYYADSNRIDAQLYDVRGDGSLCRANAHTRKGRVGDHEGNVLQSTRFRWFPPYGSLKPSEHRLEMLLPIDHRGQPCVGCKHIALSRETPKRRQSLTRRVFQLLERT
jgi:hypothetical protein